MSIYTLMISAFSNVHMPWWLRMRMFWGSSLYLKMIVILFVLLWGHFLSMYCSLESGCTPSLDTTSPKNSLLVHLKWLLFLFIFKFPWWHISITYFRILSLTLPNTLHPTVKMSSAIPFGRSSVILSVFAGSYHLLVPPQMVLWWICICQIDM